MGPGLAHLGAVRAAVDVNGAAHGIHVAQPVIPRLAARQPKDAGQYPVAHRKAPGQFRAVDLPGWPALHEYCVNWLVGTNLGADDMPAARRAVAAVALPYPVPGARYQVVLKQGAAIVQQVHFLLANIDADSRHDRKSAVARRKNPEAVFPPRRPTLRR